VPNLFEERFTTREESLEIILNSLQQAYVIDFILSQKSDLTKAIRQGLAKTNTPKEQILSANLLSMLCLTVGSHWQSLHKEFSQTLKRHIKVSTDYKAKAASIEALGVITFIWAAEEGDTIECLNFLSEILENADKQEVDSSNSMMYTSALDMWCLLSTTTSDENIIDNLLPNDIHNIIQFLDCAEVDLRLAAGETLAYLCSIARQSERDSGEDFSIYYFQPYFEVEEVLDTLRSFGHTKEHKINKKDRIKQRTGFIDILGTLQDGNQPVATVTLKKQQFIFDDWRSIKRLNIFRNILEGGFQHHMAYNTLLSQIFNIEVLAKTPALSKLEKKFYLSQSSPVAKARTQNRKTGRTNKIQRVTAFEDE